MRINLIQVGDTKAEYKELEREFQKRLKSFCTLETKIIQVSSPEEESKKIESSLKEDSYLIILDERGKELTSKDFADLVKKERDYGFGNITFVIGGPSGIVEELRKKADFLLSMSKMTIAHQIARILFLEQLYRAFTITTGHPYHK